MLGHLKNLKGTGAKYLPEIKKWSNLGETVHQDSCYWSWGLCFLSTLFHSCSAYFFYSWQKATASALLSDSELFKDGNQSSVSLSLLDTCLYQVLKEFQGWSALKDYLIAHTLLPVPLCIYKKINVQKWEESQAFSFPACFCLLNIKSHDH